MKRLQKKGLVGKTRVAPVYGMVVIKDEMPDDVADAFTNAGMDWFTEVEPTETAAVEEQAIEAVEDGGEPMAEGHETESEPVVVTKAKGKKK